MMVLLPRYVAIPEPFALKATHNLDVVVAKRVAVFRIDIGVEVIALVSIFVHLRDVVA